MGTSSRHPRELDPNPTEDHDVIQKENDVIQRLLVVLDEDRLEASPRGLH